MSEKNVYSKINELPVGKAKGPITEGACVIEGGAFRGLYNQGVLDAMMMQNIRLSATIGVSAGALAGLNYVSGQIGRSARANLRYRHNNEFIGFKALLQSHSPMDLDFLLYKLNDEPFDEDSFNDSRLRFIAVASNMDTGKAEYFEKGICSDILSAAKASASMPYISPAVKVDGKYCLDGGCTCKIPYQWAIDEGYEKIVVIRTRPRYYRRDTGTMDMRMALRVYGDYPEFADCLGTMNRNYNAQCDTIDQLEKEKRLFVIAPSAPVTVGRLEPDMEKLGDLYWMGYNDALSVMDDLKEYLNI